MRITEIEKGQEQNDTDDGALWSEQDEERMDIIGQNGNDGLHYSGDNKAKKEAVG